MKFTVKDMDISTGDIFIVLLNEHDALRMDLHAEDRVIVRKGDRWHTAIVDIAESKKTVPLSRIGLFEEVLDALCVKDGDIIDISLANKPRSVDYIRKRLDGKELTKNEIDAIIKDVVEGNLTDIELTYFVSACYTHKMSLKETVSLTKSIVEHGGQLKLDGRKVMDKHCTGGVPGNRTTMLLVPILAAAGLTIPKTSSRSITSPAGTADTMEVLAPVAIPVDKMKAIVNKVGGCIVWGGAFSLAQADDKLIQVRHPLSLDPEGMLLASIIAKKAAVNATHVLVDIPIGPDTKIKNEKEALHLEREFRKVGSRMGIKMHVMISQGNQPIGNGIGPCLEARDVLWTLKGDKRAPQDLKHKGIHMAGLLLHIAGFNNPHEMACEILESGRAYEKMKEIIEAQGGDPDVDPDKIKIGQYKYHVRANRTGIIVDIDNMLISKTARVAGAPIDKGAGIYLNNISERMKVKKGDLLYTIYAQSKEKLEYAIGIVNETPPVRIDGNS